jgi:SNF2 family DNA or RNA helicase
MKREMVFSIGEQEIDAANAAALSGKLLQMANGAVYDENRDAVKLHDRKLDALEDLIEAANGKPVLIAYWFKHDLQRLLERFPVEKLDSAESIKRWNAGKIPIGIIHPASAGHGLNLQAGGSTLVWFGLTWSLELYQQTNARLWRQGQKETVVIHHLVTEGTIDEQVMKALLLKDKSQTALIDAVKANLRGYLA